MSTSFGNIPTTYAGVRFRSRLEARYAAFFDLVKWPWEFEPIDLNGYIPDFMFMFSPFEPGAGPMLVEIKPALSALELKTYVPKIVTSGWTEHEFLVLGARMFPGDGLGLIGDNLDVRDGGPLALDSAVAFRCISCGGFSVRSEAFSHRCRVCGEREGHVGSLETGELDGLWAAAGNRVQWRAA